MRPIIGLAALARSGKDTVASVLLSCPGVAAFALADPLKQGCQALFGLSDDETWHDELKEQPIELWGHSPRAFFQTVGTEWMRHHNPDHWLMRADREINPVANASGGSTLPNLDAPDAPFALAAQAIFDFSDDQVWNPARQQATDLYWNLTPAHAIALLQQHTLAMFPDYATRRAARAVVRPKPRPQLQGNPHTIVIKDIRFENEAEFLRNHNGSIWHITRPNVQKVKSHSSELGIAQAPGDIVIINDGTLADLYGRVERAWHLHCETHPASR